MIAKQKVMMKRLFALTALCAAMTMTPTAMLAGNNLNTASTSSNCADDNPSRSEWLPEFTGVYVSAAIDIRFVQVADSEAPRILFDTKGDADTRFKASVDRHGVLNITERILRDTRSKTTVVVYYHSLKQIEVSDAYVEFDNPVKENLLRIDISGGAKLTAEMDVADLEVVLSGKSTRAKLTGRARYVEIEASSGLLDASAMEAMSVDVVASYGAGVAVRVTERLKASASTSATISYRGAPSIIKGRESILGGTVKDVNNASE